MQTFFLYICVLIVCKYKINSYENFITNIFITYSQNAINYSFFFSYSKFVSMPQQELLTIASLSEVSCNLLPCTHIRSHVKLQCHISYLIACENEGNCNNTWYSFFNLGKIISSASSKRWRFKASIHLI